MTVWEAIVLGLVQGLTEFFPISSTGHLEIFEHLFGLKQDLGFDLLVHVATLIAVVVFFRTDLLKLTRKTILLLIIGTLPVGVIGVLFKDTIESLFVIKFLAVELLINAAINFIVDHILEKRRQTPPTDLTTNLEDVSYRQALMVGVFQTLGLSPGITRSGSTVFGGVVQKLDRLTAFKFSFLLSLPAVGAASLLQFVDMYQEGFSQVQPLPYAVGFGAALLSGLASLYLFRLVLKQARMELFGWYCLGLSAVLITRLVAN